MPANMQSPKRVDLHVAGSKCQTNSIRTGSRCARRAIHKSGERQRVTCFRQRWSGEPRTKGSDTDSTSTAFPKVVGTFGGAQRWDSSSERAGSFSH